MRRLRDCQEKRNNNLQGGKKVIDLTTLSEEEKAVILAKRAYKRAWNAKNKDKVKAINDRFYKKQAEKLASQAQKETV